MGRGAGSIHGSLSGNRIAIFRLYNYTAMKSPDGADDFHGQHLLDCADGVEVLPKGLGELRVFGGLIGPDTVLRREEAELQMVAGGARFSRATGWTGRQTRVKAIGFDLCDGCHGLGDLLFGSRVRRRQEDSVAGSRQA